jgi:lipopolysaccharide-induced tumor necrosis factor-alpha factor
VRRGANIPIKIKCPECGKTLRVADEHAGRKVKCPGCQAVITIPATSNSAQADPNVPRAAPAPQTASNAPERSMPVQKKPLPAAMPPLPPPDEEFDDFADESAEAPEPVASRPNKKAARAGIRCPFCGNVGLPVIRKHLSGGGWVAFVLLLLFCLPLCWLPFVLSACKDETRKCAACGSRMG